MDIPYPWEPSVVPISILRVGQLFILGVPGEFTTMAGRRLREAVEKVLVEAGGFPTGGKVVIAGLANTYASYITTFEEYQVQRYEVSPP
jgi:neutral ceramidase